MRVLYSLIFGWSSVAVFTLLEFCFFKAFKLVAHDMQICTCCLTDYTAVIILINVYVRFEVIITVCLIVFRVVILVYVVYYVNSVFPFPCWLVLVTGKMHGRLWSLPSMHITISCASTIDICYSLLLFS